MPLESLIKFRTNDTVKQAFVQACESRETKPSDVLRAFVHDYAGQPAPTKIVTPIDTGKRWKSIGAKLTASEWQQIKPIIEAEKVTATSWFLRLVRSAIVAGPQLRKNEIEAVSQATRQLTAIGHNLNQMVRAIHEGRADRGQFSETYAKRLSNNITETTRTVNRLIQSADRRDG